ncbi:hypothetical protein HN51_050799 [Arachis hypogaea]
MNNVVTMVEEFYDDDNIICQLETMSSSIQLKLEQERKTLKGQVYDLERKVKIFRKKLVAAESTLLAKGSELIALKSNLRELEELREMKEVLILLSQFMDIDRKEKQTTVILKMQVAQLADMELLYKEGQALRKRYFNTLEGGKDIFKYKSYVFDL